MSEASDRLEKIMSALLLVGMKTWKQTEQIELLSRVGFGPTEIAKIIGTSKNVVAVAQNKMKKKKNIKK